MYGQLMTMQGLVLQVFTAIQHATAMVHAYPFLLNIDQLLDCLASQRGEATRLELLASAHTVNTASHWDRLYAYVNDLREVDYPVYVPYPKLSGGMPVTTRTQLSIKAIEHSDIF